MRRNATTDYAFRDAGGTHRQIHPLNRIGRQRALASDQSNQSTFDFALFHNQHRYLCTGKHFVANAARILLQTGKTPVADNDHVVFTLIGKSKDLTSGIRARQQERIRTRCDIITHITSCSSQQIFAIGNHQVQNTLETSHLIRVQHGNRHNIDKIDVGIRISSSQLRCSLKRLLRTLRLIKCNEHLINSHNESPPLQAK